jgi:hypothetical protein
MSIRKVGNYWTIFSGKQPVMTCTSFDRAWRLVYELST